MVPGLSNYVQCKCLNSITVYMYTFVLNNLYMDITASQMWCFARLLPLIIGEKVPKEDRFWEKFFRMLAIMDYCLSPVISKDWPAHLRVLIEEHHLEFKALYPSCALIPKMHYLVHYPEMICK